MLKYANPNYIFETVTNSMICPNNYFSVIQGYLNIAPIDILSEMIEKFIYNFKYFGNNYKAIFLVASMLTPNRYQSFSTEERLLQTIETGRSIKRKIPNSLSILIEGSVLNTKNFHKLNKEFDIVINIGRYEEIKKYVNDDRNIGHGELKLLEIGVNLINGLEITSDYVFKLGARYKLNDNFNLELWDKNKYGFRMHHDHSINADVYTTGLYSIPFNDLNNFKIILKESQHILSNQIGMIERVYRVIIPVSMVNLVETLGLEGRLSYNGTFFSK